MKEMKKEKGPVKDYVERSWKREAVNYEEDVVTDVQAYTTEQSAELSGRHQHIYRQRICDMSYNREEW